MSENVKGLCVTCVNCIRCSTWRDLKCLAHERRYSGDGLAECEDYKKRGRDFKERKCQCEDCLKNDLLHEEYLEEMDREAD